MSTRLGDSTSAEVFGRILEALAASPAEHLVNVQKFKLDIAAKIYDISDDYDFTASEITCAPASMLELGLADVCLDCGEIVCKGEMDDHLEYCYDDNPD